MIHPILFLLASGPLPEYKVAEALEGPQGQQGPSISAELFRLRRTGILWLTSPPPGHRVQRWAVVDAQTPGWARP